MDFQQFTQWCRKQALFSNSVIAEAFGVSPQTIRNWKRNLHVPFWVRYAAIAIENNLPKMELTVISVREWRSRNGLKTYEDTGAIFDIKRQTVHQWFKRGSFPNWLSLACPGYDLNSQLRTADKVIIEQSSGRT